MAQLSKDPTAAELLAHTETLREDLGSDAGPAWDFSVACAIYWFANDWHGGQGSNLYSALSTSKYRPSRSECGVSVADDYDAWEIYHALQDATGLGEG